jgi:hypothetical protein
MIIGKGMERSSICLEGLRETTKEANQSQQSVCGTKFDRKTFQIQSRSAKHSTAMYGKQEK